jgi:hypothetical protein
MHFNDLPGAALVATGAAATGASSLATWAAESPAPTTITRWPVYGAGLR